MDFFQHQDDARRQTGRMVFLFLLSVVIIIASLNAIFAGFYLYGINKAPGSLSSLSAQIGAVPLKLWITVTGITLAVIVTGSLYRIYQLSGGGQVVAKMMGARRVTRDTADPGEKQLINIVDEMSIASGVTVPQVYIMDNEAGINAFAAGYKPHEAVVAVTRGCLEQLGRDELQGVVAHEFSHILNGDMRINIRLMGVLNGILIIGIIGGFLIRSTLYSRHRHHRSTSEHGKSAFVMVMLGLALIIIGYAGVFFGRLIKAGISRQREYLADASAVQFTRSTQGITDALKKIGDIESGSLVENRHAEELSHMFFGESVKMSLSGIMATHPPLVDRIKKLNKGRIPPSPDVRQKMQQQIEQELAQARQAAAHAEPENPVVNVNPASALNNIGNPGEVHILYAAALLQSIPEPVNQALALETGSMALLIALVLDRDDSTRQMEIEVLRRSELPELESEAIRLYEALHKLGDRYRLPLLDMAIPVLKGLPPEQRQLLITVVKSVIDADRKFKFEELTMYLLISSHLDKDADKADRATISEFAAISKEIELILSLLAWLGETDELKPADIFQIAIADFRPALPPVTLQQPEQCEPDALIHALQKLALTTPALKGQIVSACMTAVMADEKATQRELEVMRAVCATMGVPVPPVLAAHTS